jgi:hypothetical protein
MDNEEQNEFRTVLKKKENELAEAVGRFQAQRFIGLFDGNIGSNTFLEIYELGKKHGNPQWRTFADKVSGEEK